MSIPKHSPTPWTQRHKCMIEDANGRGVFYLETRPDTDATADLDGPNADRIVGCVNACAELPDPEMLDRAIERSRHVLTVDIAKLAPDAHKLARFLLSQLGVSS